MFSNLRKKFSDWIQEANQRALLSGCNSRYEASITSNPPDTLDQFWRSSEINNAINMFVDSKVRELSKESKDLVRELEKEKAYANELSKKLYAAKSNVDDKDEIKRLQILNQQLGEQLKKQHDEHEKWNQRERDSQKELQEHARKFTEGQERHIQKLKERIRELESMIQGIEHSMGQFDGPLPPPPSVAHHAPPSPHTDVVSPLMAASLAANDFTEDLINHDTGKKYSKPQPKIVAVEAQKQFNTVIGILRDYLSENEGVSYEYTMLIHFEGNYRGGKTTLKTPKLEPGELYHMGFGYQAEGGSYTILDKPQETNWFLIFYGPLGDYCTNIPGLHGHEITESKAIDTTGQTCIIFTAERGPEIMSSVEDDVLSSLLNMQEQFYCGELYNMVSDVFTSVVNDSKKAPMKHHAFAPVHHHDPELEAALKASLTTYEEDNYRRDFNDRQMAWGKGGGAIESKLGDKQDSSLLDLQSRKMTPQEQLASLEQEITDLMISLNISDVLQYHTDQKDGGYRGWRRWDKRSLERLYTELKEKWLDLIEMGNTY